MKKNKIETKVKIKLCIITNSPDVTLYISRIMLREFDQRSKHVSFGKYLFINL